MKLATAKPVTKLLITLGVIVAGLAAWLLMALTPPALPRPAATNFSLHDVTVINPMMDRIEGAVLHIKGDRLELTSASQEGEEDALPSLDEYRGHYVLPGFIDMHTRIR